MILIIYHAAFVLCWIGLLLSLLLLFLEERVSTFTQAPCKVHALHAIQQDVQLNLPTSTHLVIL